MNPKPIYTAKTCNTSYKLYWTLAIFWKNESILAKSWLDRLKPLTDKDGVRILEYRQKDEATSQFLISTRPDVSPAQIIRSAKGRLQYIVRDQIPKAFKRNYSIKSIGTAKNDVIEEYLNSQIEHHKLADLTLKTKLVKYKINNSKIDLTAIRYSSHGQFIYNLHFVLVNTERYRDINEVRLKKTHDIVQRTALKKKHVLSKASFLPDHMHITVGCDINESPLQVVLAYMNNIIFAQNQVPLFENAFYVGTFGEYDLGAVRRYFSEKSQK